LNDPGNALSSRIDLNPNKKLAKLFGAINVKCTN